MPGKPRRYDFDLVLAGDFRRLGRGRGDHRLASRQPRRQLAAAGAALAAQADAALVGAGAQPPRPAGPGPYRGTNPTGNRRSDLPASSHLRAGRARARRPWAAEAARGPSHRGARAAAGPAGRARLRCGRAAATIEGGLARRQLWCPASPAIRKQCRDHAAGLPLDPADLPPLEPIAAWRTARQPRGNAAPILGRMLRLDDDRLPKSRDRALSAHPIEPDLEMRFLGGETALAGLVTPLPPAWRIMAGDDRRRAAFPRPARLLRPLSGRAPAPVPARRPAGHGGRQGGGDRPRVPDDPGRWPRLPRAGPSGGDRSLPAGRAPLLRPLRRRAGRGPGRAVRAAAAVGPAGRACSPAAPGAPAAARQAADDRLLPDQRRGPGPCDPAARDRPPPSARLRADLFHPLPCSQGHRACRLPHRICARGVA